MVKRRFGKTGLELSVLTLGAMRIPPEPDETPEQTSARAQATMRAALDAGINHIETARGYGPSEGLIGEALRAGVINRSEFILTTKIGPGGTANEFRADLDDSMQRMGVDRIDNLDVHGINTPELLEATIRPDGALTAIRKAQAEGLVGSVGFATHGPVQVIMDAIATDEFDSVNLHYYYMNQRNRPAVQLAASKGMGVFIISPTDKGGLLHRPPARLSDLCAPLTPIQANQRWLLSQPEVHTLSMGAARPSDIPAHLPGASVDGPLTPEEAAAIARLDQALEDLAPHLCTNCGLCLPCPEDVGIPEVLRLRNMNEAFGMKDFGQYRYGLFVRHDEETGEPTGGGGHWFPGRQADFCNRCGDCLPRCPQNLPIPDLLNQTHQELTGKPGNRLWK